MKKLFSLIVLASLVSLPALAKKEASREPASTMTIDQIYEKVPVNGLIRISVLHSDDGSKDSSAVLVQWGLGNKSSAYAKDINGDYFRAVNSLCRYSRLMQTNDGTLGFYCLKM